MELQLKSQKRQNNIIKKISELTQKISAQKIIYAALIFFISMAKLPFGTLSLGCAAFAAEFSLTPPLITGIIVLCASFAGAFSTFEILQTTLTLLIFCAASSKIRLNSNKVFKSIALSLSVLFCTIVPKLFGTLYLYDTILIFAESLCFFVLTYTFQKAKSELLLKSKNIEGTLSLAISAGVVILGATSVSFENINLGIALSILLLLIFSFENGASSAAIAGIVVGVFLGISLGNVPYFVMLFSVSALLAGALSHFGKAVSAAAFVLCASFSVLYAPNSVQGFVTLSLYSFGAIIFMLLPKRFSKNFSFAQKSIENQTKTLGTYTSNTLFESACAIEDISNTFKTLAENSASASASFFERSTARLCSDCPMQNHCWKSEFHRTYTSFFVLTQLCTKNGSVSYADVPAALSEKCMKAGNITNTFNSMYDIYKVDKLWEERISESREMVSCLLDNISLSLKNKWFSSLENIKFMPLACAALQKSFDKQNIKVEKIFVFSGPEKETFADITFSDINDIPHAEAICRSTLGNYKIIYTCENFVRLSLFPEHNFTTAIAQKPKKEECINGDSTIYSYCAKNRFAMLLSDGMGSGNMASSQSMSTLSLAQKLLQNGFSAEKVAEIINSSLVLKSTEVSFASVDMTVIDFKTACANFYKMGAAPTFIKNGTSIKTICSATLPAGSNAKSDISHITHDISKGDFIIMMSDGVATGENTEELEKIIANFSGSSHQMANMLISYSENCLNHICDDKTVMVTCIN